MEVEGAGVLTGWGWDGAAAKSTTSSGFSVTQTLIIFFTSFLSCPVLCCSLVFSLVYSFAPPLYLLLIFRASDGRKPERGLLAMERWRGVCSCVCRCMCMSVKAGGVWVSFAKSFSSWDSSAKRPLGYGLNFPFSPLLSLSIFPHCCVQPWGRVRVGLLPTSCKRKPPQLQR